MTDLNDSFNRIDSDFIIFAEIWEIIQPTNGTLDYPEPGKLLPLLRFDFL